MTLSSQNEESENENQSLNFQIKRIIYFILLRKKLCRIFKSLSWNSKFALSV